MKLVEFIQGVSISTQEIQNYLVFERDDGSHFQLPVPDETIQALLPEVYGKKPVNKKPSPAPEDKGDPVPEATLFGEDDAEHDKPVFAPEPDEPRAPLSEGEVPSL